MLTGMFQGPQRCGQLRRSRFELHRQVDVESPEPHAILAQLRARGLVQRLDFFRDRLALENAEVFLQLERDPTR